GELRRHAQPLAFGGLAPQRRRPEHVGAVADGYACAPLARASPYGRHGTGLSGPLQVVSRPGGWPLLHLVPLRGAQSAPGQTGKTGGTLALVESMAPCSCHAGALVERRSPARARALAGVRQWHR